MDPRDDKLGTNHRVKESQKLLFGKARVGCEGQFDGRSGAVAAFGGFDTKKARPLTSCIYWGVFFLFDCCSQQHL